MQANVDAVMQGKKNDIEAPSLHAQAGISLKSCMFKKNS